MTDKEKPLGNVDVEVYAAPRDERSPEDRRVAKGVEKNLKKKVHRAIREKKGKGSKEQLAAAEKEVDEAKESISRRRVKKIHVKVVGKIRDKDGEVEEDIERKRSFVPQEGGED